MRHFISLLKKSCFERGLSKSLKKLTLFFLSNSVLFNGQDYKKQEGPGTCDQLLFRLQEKFRQIPFLVRYYLTKSDDVTVFEIFQKLHHLIYATNSWHHYSTFIRPFEFGTCDILSPTPTPPTINHKRVEVCSGSPVHWWYIRK